MRTGTPARLRIGSGQTQRRKVQRRDCLGGGEGSRSTSAKACRSACIASADKIETVAGSCPGPELERSFFASGKGAWDMAQQATVCTFQVSDGCVGISIWSQGDGLSIDSQSAAKEEASAHREIGLGPTRISPMTIVKLRSLFTASIPCPFPDS